MLFFLDHGHRVIAHDRRGHGRSAQVSEGNGMNHYADDPAELTEHPDLRDAVHVGTPPEVAKWRVTSDDTVRAGWRKRC